MEDKIKEAIKLFRNASDEDKNKAMDLFVALRGSNIWVPCNAILGDADKKQWEDLIDKYKDNLDGMKDEVVTSKDPTRLVPDILTNGTDYFFPVFSTPEEMGEYGNRFSKVESGFRKAISLASNNPKNVAGLVINPFSDPFIIKREAFDLFLNFDPVADRHHLRLFHCSCLDQQVDAVVNAANCYLAEGGGVCGAIFKKAGSKELREACSNIQKPLKDGQAVITPAFNISNAKTIIHAVGPDFSRKPTAFKELFEAYYNSLLVLKENNLHSISFPLISSGIYGGMLENPVAESTEQCCRAFDKFISEFSEYQIDVRLCAFTAEETEKASKALALHSQKMQNSQN